jgi:hypothetical protein
MDVVQKLLREKNELFETIKKNCIVPEVHTGHCQDCHQTHDEINNYKQETLEIPIKDECPCNQEDIEQQPQQNVPLFL